MDIAAYAVFRRIKAYEFYIGSFEEYINCRLEIVVNSCGVGYKSHSFAMESFEVVVAENFYAGFYLCGEAECHRSAKSR